MEYDIEQIEKQNEKRKRTKQIVKKLLFIIIIILLYNIFLITKSTLDKTDAKSMFGYRAYVITTNSMEPTINVGDIIIVSGIEKDKIRTDKIVTFEQNNQIITHRIVGIEETEKGSKYVTKGDNNLTKDTEEISYEQILGTIVLKIPRIGNIILLLEDKGTLLQAVDLATELFFNYNLHPAIITACKNSNELDVYLSCLEYNELEDFTSFKIVFQGLPAVSKKAFKRGHNLMNKINNVESANNSSTTNQETNANINS